MRDDSLDDLKGPWLRFSLRPKAGATSLGDRFLMDFSTDSARASTRSRAAWRRQRRSAAAGKVSAVRAAAVGKVAAAGKAITAARKAAVHIPDSSDDESDGGAAGGSGSGGGDLGSGGGCEDDAELRRRVDSAVKRLLEIGRGCEAFHARLKSAAAPGSESARERASERETERD